MKKFDIFRHFRLFQWTTCGSKSSDTFGLESWNTYQFSVDNSSKKLISCWKSCTWTIESEIVESTWFLCSSSAIGCRPKTRSHLISDLQKRRCLSLWTSSVKQASIVTNRFSLNIQYIFLSISYPASEVKDQNCYRKPWLFSKNEIEHLTGCTLSFYWTLCQIFDTKKLKKLKTKLCTASLTLMYLMKLR